MPEASDKPSEGPRKARKGRPKPDSETEPKEGVVEEAEETDEVEPSAEKQDEESAKGAAEAEDTSRSAGSTPPPKAKSEATPQGERSTKPEEVKPRSLADALRFGRRTTKRRR